MINNFSKYVKDISGERIITNGYDANIDGNLVFISQTGGSDNFTRGLKEDLSVQMIVRDAERPKAYFRIRTINNLLKNRFNIVLPEVTVDGETFPEVVAWQILPIQEPGYLGTDDNGLHEWSVNYRITIRSV